MCALIGILNMRKAAELAFMGLHVMQHRAVDYAGIVTSDGTHLYPQFGTGKVREIFTEEVLGQLHGRHALGHTRYPTVNDQKEENRNLIKVQPIKGSYRGKEFYLAHNGNLTNLSALDAALGDVKCITTMDSERIVRLLEQERTDSFEDELVRVLKLLRGSYALIILFGDRLVAVRDPQGVRPLTFGQRDEATVVASETCALEALNVPYGGEAEAGTFVVFEESGVSKVYRFAAANLKKCSFEQVYFSHPASDTYGQGLVEFRLAIGRALRKRYPAPGAEIVMGVPDSGVLFAIGYADATCPYIPGIFRNHYVGRTFIEATPELQGNEVGQKFQIARSVVAGRRFVLVDDSIVRLRTGPQVMARLRAAGAREIHVRIAFPPVRHPCLYGINTPTYEELFASTHSVAETREQLGADSLEYLDLPTLLSLLGKPEGDWCTACVDGSYWHDAVAA